MKRTTRRLLRLVPVLPISMWVAGCYADAPEGEDVPTEDPECQIQTEGEKSPGYPFDLALYTDQVLPVLTANCAAAGCHAAPEGQGQFTVWAAAVQGNCEYAQTFNSLKKHIDLANPANSAVLVAINGSNPLHPLVYTADDPRLTALKTYADDASARFQSDGGGGGPAPPGASPFDYQVFQTTIQPILDNAEGRGCSLAGCHGTGAGLFTLIPNPAPNSPDMEANFAEVTRRTNLNAPEASLFLLQASTRHGANASTIASPTEQQAILAWIQAAADVTGGEPPPTCAPIDKFNVAVFRDEIYPILNGAVDLNNPGDAAGLGCTRGPCHGTERGPGTLFLSDSLAADQNLQNFVCFVDLTSPSSSSILTCPLNDPRCPKYPHPGQDVFFGAQDFNYQRVLSFLFGAQLDATPLDFAYFARRINPIFNDLNAVEGGAQGRTCADAVSCHGVNVVGQPAPNGSNFPILPNAADFGRLTYNFTTAASFVNFLDPDESSLFLYPTNEIANVVDHPFATGLPHPGGADFAVDSVEAQRILKWAGGLRPDNNGFVVDWLVAGDYPATSVVDATPISELAAEPKIFDPTGAPQFNNGQWDGLFVDDELVDLNVSFPRAATAGRIAYAVVYVVNTASYDITAQISLQSENDARLYVGGVLVGQSDGAGATGVATLPAFGTSKTVTRIMVKLFQSSVDDSFAFTLQLRDEFGTPLTDTSGELILLLGPQGGI